MQIRRRSPGPAVAVESLRYQVQIEGAEPQHILEEIVWYKEKEVDKMREQVPLMELQHKALEAPATRDFVAALRQGKTQPALIAEVKKASPSKGVIREEFDPIAIAQAYEAGGASCVSVLTDEKFFQGSFSYLRQIRQTIDCPLLCKDFVIYPYQLYLARVNGADAVLLIAAILPDRDLQYFLKIIKALGMSALIEVHTLEELDRVLTLQDVALVGINNRNLKDFSVNLDTTRQILAARGDQLQARNILVVSESGLHTAADLQQVHQAGASAVLIGESLMKQPHPGVAIGALFV
ncbi:indole-3-glycerol phosphate synthase TrpC [Thermocoleostomius sinensis]|jgi:indole-3-glycerol phosphate synthase|uniref:Indole-3-glycerol phosphate synthase n=1 Tax=Thermocoleostomius sinensis A174 TaxID=2016057 RepID=A0A9E8ZCV9_9CYAN|nr:indole-3-glycerol phosphate synthase TrpC [Thermocoleostomius sinensis]WAL60939.1 indole-3-glycerol phosphate synthase TrpC [Thermocoleostomius sinensis A174]